MALRNLIVGSVVALVALIPIGFVANFKGYRLPTGGMAPTIQPGEHVLTRRASAAKRGAVIAFRYPIEANVMFMQRVVALPGETVEIRDKQLFVNGRKMDEPYAIHDDPQIFPRSPSLPEPYRSRDQFGPYTIAAGNYFVLGDNRDRSSDSRYWGTVPRENIEGVAVLVYSARGMRRVR